MVSRRLFEGKSDREEGGRLLEQESKSVTVFDCKSAIIELSLAISSKNFGLIRNRF
jgi:hypothetical protein